MDMEHSRSFNDLILFICACLFIVAVICVTLFQQQLTRMHVLPPQAARVLNVEADASANVTAATINGKRLQYETNQGHGWQLSYFAVPLEGFELIIEMRSGAPLKLTLAVFSDGPPAIAPAPVTSRPTHLVPTRFSDMTSVVKRFDLAGC